VIRASARRLSRRVQEKACDDLCREIVFRRDRHRCVKTGKTTHLQWCHVVTRGFKRLRWHPDNCLTLNAGQHLWWHQHPLEAAAWFEATYPDRVQWLLLARQTRNAGRLDLGATLLWLKAQEAK
jgi:hypothetical protein